MYRAPDVPATIIFTLLKILVYLKPLFSFYDTDGIPLGVKVMATVVEILKHFTNQHPGVEIYFEGSTRERTKLYDRILRTYYPIFCKEFLKFVICPRQKKRLPISRKRIPCFRRRLLMQERSSARLSSLIPDSVELEKVRRKINENKFPLP